MTESKVHGGPLGHSSSQSTIDADQYPRSVDVLLPLCEWPGNSLFLAVVFAQRSRSCAEKEADLAREVIDILLEKKSRFFLHKRNRVRLATNYNSVLTHVEEVILNLDDEDNYESTQYLQMIYTKKEFSWSKDYIKKTMLLPSAPLPLPSPAMPKKKRKIATPSPAPKKAARTATATAPQNNAKPKPHPPAAAPTSYVPSRLPPAPKPEPLLSLPSILPPDISLDQLDKGDIDSALAAAILRGVTQRPSGKWQAQLYFAGKSRYIGVFETRQKAAYAYEIARQILKNTPKTGKNDPKSTEALVESARRAAFHGVRQKLGLGPDELKMMK